MMADTIQNVRTGRQVDEENASDVKKFLSILEATAITMERSSHEVELTEGGALFYCAKDRMSQSMIRNYTKWTLDNNVSESFHTQTLFLSEWLKILESTAFKVKGHQTVMSYDQAASKFKRKNDSADKFKVLRPYHRSEMSQSQSYYLDMCSNFKALSIKQRRDFVFKHKL